MRRAYTALGRASSGGFLRRICSSRSSYLLGRAEVHQSPYRSCATVRTLCSAAARLRGSGASVSVIRSSASRASWSAALFPGIPAWPGIHLTCTGAMDPSTALWNLRTRQCHDVVFPVRKACAASALSSIMYIVEMLWPLRLVVMASSAAIAPCISAS